MSITTNFVSSSPMTTKMWSSLLLKQNKKWSSKSSAKFQVFAVKSENGIINRMEDLLNLDLTPFTDKVIAEYIWYMFFLIYICYQLLVQLTPCEHSFKYKIVWDNFEIGLDGLGVLWKVLCIYPCFEALPLLVSSSK